MSRFAAFIILAIASSIASANQGNLTTCILAPPTSAAQSGQPPTLTNSQPIQQIQSTDLPSTSSQTGSESNFRSLAPGFNRTTQNRTSNFWDRPSAQGGFRKIGDAPVSSFDEQQKQVALSSRDGLKNTPQTPVYDRSGFRREPLHPSFVEPNSRKNAQGEAIPRTGESPWNRFATPPPNQGNTVPTFTPFDAITPDADFSPSTSFFDPTRKPKDFPGPLGPTTPNPLIGARSGPSGGGKARTGPNTPALTREVSGGGKTGGKGASGRSRSSLEPQASGTNSNDPDYQKVPEYAYVKQPISKILDEPDLELEGKSVKFGIMKDALDRVGLLELASGAGPVTIFCPTDDAFMALPDDELIKLQQNPIHLRNTMLRHIVNFDVPPESLKNNMVIPSYSGEPLIINVVAGGKLMLVRGTPIIAATNAQNGVIYVISKVMAEETKSTSLLEELEKESDVSIFNGYIKRSAWLRKLQGAKLAVKQGAIDDELLSQGPFTVFAPNNTAFEKLSPASRQVLEYNPAALERLLSYHVISGAVFQKELELLDSLPPKDDRREPLKLQALPDGSININDAGSIQKADISTGNGVVHVIDGVILPSDLATTFRRIEARNFFSRQPQFNSPGIQSDQPPQGVPGGAVGTTPVSPSLPRPRFGFSRRDSRNQGSPAVERSGGLAIGNQRGRTGGDNSLALESIVAAEAPLAGGSEPTTRFYRWLHKSGFMNVLNNTGNNYTVVLPIDKAVNRLPLKYQQTLDRDNKQLESLLMYHIIPGAVNMTRLKNEDVLPSVSGRDIRVTSYNGSNNETKISLSGAAVINDTISSNGKIRFLMTERVMYPPQGNLQEVISRSPILKTMSSLVKVAQLEAGLADVGPFTLFAPSDDAFSRLPSDSLDFLSNDPKSARAFILRHIVRPLVFTSSVPIGNSTVVESTTGERLEIFRERDLVKVDGVAIKYADITATNGVIHVIDHVL